MNVNEVRQIFFLQIILFSTDLSYNMSFTSTQKGKIPNQKVTHKINDIFSAHCIQYVAVQKYSLPHRILFI